MILLFRSWDNGRGQRMFLKALKFLEEHGTGNTHEARTSRAPLQARQVRTSTLVIRRLQALAAPNAIDKGGWER